MQNNGFNEPMVSQAQIELLKKLGYTGAFDGMTMKNASALIMQLKKQDTQPQQAQQAHRGGTTYNGFNEPQYQQQDYNIFDNQQPGPQPSATYQQPKQKYEPQVTKNDVAAIREAELADSLMNNLNELANNGELFIPENYSVGNAIKSAMSKILTSEQADKLLACTPESKKQALTEYIVQGLDASKTQAYFIPYGNKMTMMRSYFGDVAVVKRTGLVKDVYAVCIYQGDEIEIGFDDYGRKTLIKHVTKFENQDNEIIGAYAVAVGINEYKAYEFMTRKELEASWKMSKMPNGKLHSDYKQEAAKRTVIRRLVKWIFNSSLNTTEEQTTLIGSYNRTLSDEYDNEKTIDVEVQTAEVNAEQKKKTASKKINIDTTPESSTEEWPE